MPLLWFHAFRRPTIVEVVEVLRVGAMPPPAGVATQTRDLEQHLGLNPNVYAYLGRTLECFGNTALAVAMEAAEGLVSPFDTGGLVNKISPVSGWPDEEKRKYLGALTWPFADLAGLLLVYPGNTAASIHAYLTETKPPQAGPHALWNKGPTTAIWSNNDDWRAWTWEVRSERQLATARHVLRWSCTVPLYQQFLEYAETLTNPVIQAEVEDISSKYVEGGVSRLIRELREHQERLS